VAGRRGGVARFNFKSEDLGGFRETIRPGAFAKSLSQSRVIKMFWNHNQDIPLGSTRAGLTLVEDDKGLVADVHLPDTQAGRDMALLVRDRIVDSMSFGFQTLKNTWNKDLTHRELVEVRLFEVSPVTGWPAYSGTSVTVRELAEELGIEPTLLVEAFRVMQAPVDSLHFLTDEQHRALIENINARYPSSVVHKSVVEWRAQLAAKGIAA
jgi:HK97 family phage prohead protease